MNDTERPEPAADMVHAVHEALVNSAPGWIIDREDGELLDMARAALQAAAVPAGDDVDLTTAYMTGYLAGKDDDAAIAVLEAMLLSDEVVVAAGDVIAGEFYADLPMMTGEAYSQVAKAALQAALSAVKGTEGSGDG